LTDFYTVIRDLRGQRGHGFESCQDIPPISLLRKRILP